MAELNKTITSIMPNNAAPSNGANWPNRQTLTIVSSPIAGENKSQISWSLDADYGTAGHSYDDVTCKVKFTLSGGATKVSGTSEWEDTADVVAPDENIHSGSFVVEHASDGTGTIAAETSFTGINEYSGSAYTYAASGSWALPARDVNKGHIYSNGQYRDAKPYIYTGGQWKPAKGYTYSGGQWKEAK